MDLQLDSKLRIVLKLVRSSLRTDGIPLENAIRELRRVTESIQNANRLHHTQSLPDEKNGKYASKEEDQFRLKHMLDRL